jgi:hypothetical protein
MIMVSWLAAQAARWPLGLLGVLLRAFLRRKLSAG